MSTLADFPVFSKETHARLESMSKQEMFVVSTADIYASYLAAFPQGTNPIFRTRTEHDCSCCKQFIRSFGRTVSIVNGKRQSVWGTGDNLPYPYNQVAAKMNALVQQAPIESVFRTKERRYGAETTTEMMGEHAHVWHHFHGVVASRHYSATPDAARGELTTTAQLLRRGLEELTIPAVDEVIRLINNRDLYRGAEFLPSVKAFRALQADYQKAPDRDLMIWANVGAAATRFRNTAIGTLVQDLSGGLEIELAIRSFEAKVAPINYKRPKAVVTPKMVDAALATLANLGLETAVERRFARFSDMSVNDVLFVDNNVQGAMRDGLRAVLMASTTPNRQQKEAQSISIEDFVASVLPNARELSLHLQNDHLSHFVSLTAPQHAQSGRLFKWDNGFAWSYDGDVADSIKERVKRAGGNTNAALRVSLAWNNHDDLDIHAYAPGKRHIYFGNKEGVLDVDQNAPGTRLVRDPVENLSWDYPSDGEYEIEVNMYIKRDTNDGGFTLEVECAGVTQRFSSPRSPTQTRRAKCLSFTMKKGILVDLKLLSTDLRGGDIPAEKWGLKTHTDVRVSAFINSPNHWVGAGSAGAKHWFFILEGCKNPEGTRGIYNEFLRSEMEPQRRVFELLGSKTRCPPQDEQMSGVGFTAGRGDRVKVTVGGAKGSSRTYEVNF